MRFAVFLSTEPSQAALAWKTTRRDDLPVYGTYHHVTPDYLGMYADEFAFRFNARQISDGERVASALMNVEGRLTWCVGASC